MKIIQISQIYFGGHEKKGLVRIEYKRIFFIPYIKARLNRKNDQTERRNFRKQLKETMSLNVVAQGVGQVVKEIQVAITTAVMASTMATTSGK